MEKLISIIIPRYSEDMDTVTCAVSSIFFQANVDRSSLEIILVDDNPDNPLPEDGIATLKRAFSIDIHYYVMKANGGPGVARQKGIDESCGKFVMFMDCDDSFNSPSSLYYLITTIKKNPETDYLQSYILEECFDANGELAYITHEFENTWLFGKMIRRSLLDENGIRFHNELRLHEDTYFLMLVGAASKSRMIVNTPTYVWKNNVNSLTRKEPHYIQRYFDGFIHATMLAVDELKKINPERSPLQLAQNVCTFFFMLQEDSWMLEDVMKYRDLAIRTLKKEMEGRWNEYDDVSRDYIREVYNVERAEHFQNGEMELYSLDEWVQMLRE